jgi:predicted phage terminase large subunit-like protein
VTAAPEQVERVKRAWPFMSESERRFVERYLGAQLRLVEFIRSAWRYVEPNTPYVHGRHIEVISEHLEGVSRGQIDKLLINIPVRAMKSLITCVFWPAWHWGPFGDPGARFIFASYSQKFAVRDSLRTRRIVESLWYQNAFPGVRLLGDQNEKLRFDNTAGGMRLSSSVEGGLTGEGGDFVVADDPHNAKKIWSETTRRGTIEWWDDVMSSRTGRYPTNRRVVVMQRLHEEDLSGHILDQLGDYVHLFLPQEYDPALKPGRAGRPARSKPSPFQSEWRTQYRQLLWPERFTRAIIDDIKQHQMTAYAYGAQHQQVPSPSEGGIFKREHWRYWEPPDEDLGPVITRDSEGNRLAIMPRKLPFQVGTYAQGWDFTFKGRDVTRERDYVSGQVWCEHRTDGFLMDRIYQQMDFPTTIRAVLALSEAWPEAETKYYEDAANGPAIEATLRGEIGGLIAVPVDGDLLSRAHAIHWLQESGHLYLPHPSMCPWVTEFVELAAAFGSGAAHDDDIAAMVTVLRKLFPVPALNDSAPARTRRPFPIFQS